MPPLKSGKIVSQTGKVVSAPVKKEERANVREDRSPAPKATTKPKSDTVQAARVESASKKSADANTKAFKNSLPSLNSSFKGVGYIPPSGSKTEDPPKVIPKSGGNSAKGGSGNTDEEFEPETPAMDPTPDPPTAGIMPAPETIVKTPTRNVTDISSLVPQYSAQQIQAILFENLSAVELSRIERHDTIEGIQQRYSIISNLSEIRSKYQQTKQLTIMDKFKPLTSVFTINIQDKIPQEDYILLENLNATYKFLDENNQLVDREKGYYYIDTNGDLVIELINIEKSQQVEVQIDTNGTIYKVEL